MHDDLPFLPQALMKMKAFFALSRTPHGVIDLATPALSALLWLGHFPAHDVVIVGLITAFAGYTAVYALNDIADYHIDKDKIMTCGLSVHAGDIDGVFARHPMAQGILTYRAGLIWAGLWVLLALIGAFWLNPFCALILFAGCFLEFIYCKLFQISKWRALISGIVKTLGGMAAIYAVDYQPSPLFLGTIFLWIFMWEIGGQNIPNDWTDEQEDLKMKAKTIPVQFGKGTSSLIIVVSLVLSVFLNFVIFHLSPIRVNWFTIIVTIGAVSYFLLYPAYRLYRIKSSQEASNLFNKASYYPLILLIVLIIGLTI
jgi:4-hydroxybenzoate polyprenyltransferase